MKKNEAGFTLLEVIIAMSIMVMAFASILAIEGASIRSSGRAKQMSIVGMLVKNRAIETELNLEGKDFSEVKTEETGQCPPPFENYSWRTQIKEIEFPNLDLDLSGEKPEDPASSDSPSHHPQGNFIVDRIKRMITDFLSQSMREVTVTLFWKTGSQEQSFSLSFFWVKFDVNLDSLSNEKNPPP